MSDKKAASIKDIWGAIWSVFCLAFAALISFVCILSTGCLTDGPGVNRNTNESAVTKAELPSGGHLIEVDLYESADNYCERLINETSPKLELAPLSKAARSEVFEFRIWTNLGGLSDPKLLRVYSINSGNSGSIFDLTREKGSLELRKKEPLPAPLSGWNKMLFEVRSRLSTPKGLVREPQFSLNRDEPLIVLEVLDKGDYGRVLYGRGTTFPDGKRLIEVCNYLASEFAVDMDCGGERR